MATLVSIALCATTFCSRKLQINAKISSNQKNDAYSPARIIVVRNIEAEHHRHLAMTLRKILEDMRPESVQLYCTYLVPNSFAQTAQSGPVSTRRMGPKIVARAHQDVIFPWSGILVTVQRT